MRVCSSCGRENPDDRDFCECGEYLRWEPTGFMQAVTPDQAAPAEPAAPAAPAQPPADETARPAHIAPAQPPTPEPSAGNGGGSAVTSGDPLGAPAAPPPPAQPQTVAPPAAPPPGPTPTAVHQAVPQPAPPAQALEPDSAAITLRLPEGDSAKDETLTMGVHPGGRERLIALVRNQSGIVDNYKITVEGLPEDWYTCYPDTVYLVPYGTGGTYEQDVEIHLHPPKSPEAEARVWELTVVADSRAHNTRAAQAPFLLGMQPYVEHETKVQPERVSGRRKATFEVTVKNKANDVMLVGLEASDPDSELEYEFEPPMCELKPGQTQTTTMRVRPPKQIWLGRPTERRMEVATLANEQAEQLLLAHQAAEAEAEAEGEGQDAPPGEGVKGKLRRGRGKVPVYGPRVYKPQLYKPNVYAGPSGLQVSKPMVRGPQMYGPQMGAMNLNLNNLRTPNLAGGGGAVVEGPVLPNQAVFRQKPWLPWWLAVVIPLLAALALMLFLLLPKNTTVPELVGLPSVSDAEQKLVDAKLKLSAKPPEEKVTDEAEPGTIIGQVPKEGQKAEEGSEVSVVVAVGNGTVKVPDLAKLKVIDAEKLLREKKLTLGAVSPEKKPDGVIKSQIPAPGDPVKEGAPIDVFLTEPKAAEGEDGEGDGDGGGGGGGGGGGEGGAITVPAVEGADVKAYAQKVGDLGLTPVQENVFSDQPAGAVVGTEPEGGTEVETGATVTVLVSAGFPQLAFDDGKNILLINGATGKRLPSIAKTRKPEKDPTFSADGTRVAYIAGRQVFLANQEQPDQDPVALTSDLDQFTDVAWAPTTDANVLALVRSKGGDTDLCFGAISSAGLGSPKCIAEKAFQVGRTIHWAPDGKEVYVFGARGQTGQFGMVRYRSRKAFSADAGDWGKGRFVTDVSQTNKGVLDLAISPNGKRMAAVADTETATPQLYLTTPDDLLLTETKPLQVRGCKVAWRADSREVVVVQGVTCQESTGQLVRVPVNDPTNVVALNANGDNPSYQPITPK